MSATTGSILHILDADVASLQALLTNGPVFVAFQDGTGQYAKVFSAVSSGGIGILTAVVGETPTNEFAEPVNHAAGTVISAEFIAGGNFYTIGPVELITPTTSKLPGPNIPAQSLFMDSCQHWTGPTDVQFRKWFDTGVTTVSTSYGTGIEMAGVGPSKTLLTETTVITLGVRYSRQAFSNGIIDFFNTLGTPMASLTEGSTSGKLKVTFGAQSSADLVGFTMVTNTIYYIEFQAVLSAALKLTYRVRIWDNALETKIIDVTGNLTDDTATYGRFSSFRLLGPGGGNKATAGDIYVTNNKLLGDVTINYLKAVSAGDLTQGSVSNGPGPNWDMNSDGSQPDDNTTSTDYSAQNQRDLYHVDTLAPIAGKEPVAFQFVSCQEHVGTSTSTGMIALKSGTQQLQQTSIYGCYSQFNYGLSPGLVNPVTGVRFTWAEVNALQTGPMRNA